MMILVCKIIIIIPIQYLPQHNKVHQLYPILLFFLNLQKEQVLLEVDLNEKYHLEKGTAIGELEKSCCILRKYLWPPISVFLHPTLPVTVANVPTQLEYSLYLDYIVVFRICQQITSITVRQSGTARNSFPTEIGCSKPRFILTYGIILVYRTAKVCSKVELFCTSAVKLNFTAHFCSSVN